MGKDSSHEDPDVHKYWSWFSCCKGCFSDRITHGRPDPSCLLYTDVSLPADTRRLFRWSRPHPPTHPRPCCLGHGCCWTCAARSRASPPCRSWSPSCGAWSQGTLLRDHSGWPHRISWSYRHSSHLPSAVLLFPPPCWFRFPVYPYTYPQKSYLRDSCRSSRFSSILFC